MKPWIIKHFPKTEEAVLVDKWFGTVLGTNVEGQLHGLALEGKEKEILKLARELERDEESKKRK